MPNVSSGTDISTCEWALDNITQDCISTRVDTPGGFKLCDEYIQPAAACLKGLTWKGARETSWSDALPSYVIQYMLTMKGVHAELEKKEYGRGLAIRTESAFRKIFLASISHSDRELIATTAKATGDILNTYQSKGVNPVFKEHFVDYIQNANLLKFLPLGVTLGEDRDAALVLLKILALSKQDSMKEGWENKYLTTVFKYFPPKPLVP